MIGYCLEESLINKRRSILANPNNTMQNKRIIVTGGSGKTGPWIIKHLIEEGYEVINVDNRMPSEEALPHSHL